MQLSHLAEGQFDLPCCVLVATSLVTSGCWTDGLIIKQIPLLGGVGDGVLIRAEACAVRMMRAPTQTENTFVGFI